MTSARDEILGRLREVQQTVNPRQLPDPWTSLRQFDDLAARFASALTAAKGEVLTAASLDAALSHLDDLLREMKIMRGVVSFEPPLVGIDWEGRFPGISWHRPSKADEYARQKSIDADVGISSGVVGLAETGSVGVVSGPFISRLGILLPPVHLVLLPASKLTPDLFTWSRARSGEMPANLVFVSGPSKSADIAQTLAVGVHGPGRFIVIVYND